jgi:hypothetical protein
MQRPAWLRKKKSGANFSQAASLSFPQIVLKETVFLEQIALFKRDALSAVTYFFQYD